MREFNINLRGIFSGLDPKEVPDRANPSLIECLNLVPTDSGYKLHEFIIDINSSLVTPEPGPVLTADVWKDHEDDIWLDHDVDYWKDNPELS